jgi:hypothetical protein
VSSSTEVETGATDERWRQVLHPHLQEPKPEVVWWCLAGAEADGRRCLTQVTSNERKRKKIWSHNDTWGSPSTAFLICLVCWS